MSNFEEIVVRIAESKGINFATLPKEKQNIVIGELFAHLECIFRDMADYPDDRFGRRKGIYKNSFANPSEENDPNNPNNHNNPNNSIQTTSDTSCPDQGCMLVASGCGVGDKNCPENDGKSCDNKCSNSNTAECTDNFNCVDNECDNSGGAQECVDNANCQDTECQNSAGGTSGAIGCVDNQNCTDISGCTNSPPPGAECRDNNNCIDTECKNQARAGLCTDTTGCKDDMCCNRRCEDKGTNEAACLDDMCGNGRVCTDNSTTTGGEAFFCKDDGCVNSPDPVTPNCRDTNCVDESCVNFDGCVDNSQDGICTDRTCKSAPQGTDYTSQCTNEGTGCTYDSGHCPNFSTSCTDSFETCVNNTSACVNSSAAECNPWYIDGIQCETALMIENGDAVNDIETYILEADSCDHGGCTFSTCNNVISSCTDDGCVFSPQCNDFGQFCRTNKDRDDCEDGANNNYTTCADEYCYDTGNCINSRQCSDRKECADLSCKNTGTISYCVDYGGCIDKTNCKNENFCQDQTNCQDGTASGEKCINSRCINVAQNCTDLNCEVGKCMDYKERYTDSVEECHDYICDP